jgi:hypothetical protein
MNEDMALQRFRRFRAMFVDSNIPNSLLLEMIENFITDDEEALAQNSLVFDDQLSLQDSMA